MFITDDEIDEVVQCRAYEQTPLSVLSNLLDAFESFRPSLESYSAAAEDAAAEDSPRDSTPTPAAYSLAETVEPAVSRSIFEILAEIVVRDIEHGHDPRDRYEEWRSRGFHYGFGPDDLDRAARAELAVSRAR